ncbi:MAG: xanthine dehydrogenase small subunit [Phyllobacterium sp.]
MARTTRFYLNGKIHEADIRPDTTVLEWLRGNARLTGTKEGCAEGDCGACSILIGDVDGGAVRYHAANSCILVMGQIDGRALVTIEGLKGEALHPIQEAMAENGSSQCGFCTPGIVMSLAGLAASADHADDEAIHDALAGNLCRCTGYRPIVEAARKVIHDGGTGIPGPESTALKALKAQRLVASSDAIFHQPTTLRQLLELRRKRPDAVLLAGGTDLGVALADYHAEWSEVISTAHVRELRSIRETRTNIRFGAAVTWEEILAKVAPLYPSFATLIRRFGSTQIRSMGTVGGNIGTASPIGDGPPALIALAAEIELASLDGVRSMPLEAFFLDYRKTELRPDEVVSAVTIPKPAPGQEFRVYKVSKRYDQDISTVCAAFSVRLDDNGFIRHARIAFGGMAATPQRAEGAEFMLIGNRLDEAAAKACGEAIAGHFKPLTDWRGSSAYRSEVAANLVERFRRDVAGETVEVMAL